MSDISYEILDLFKKYGSSRQGVEDALRADHRSQVLYALDEGRENLLEWVEFSGEDRILQMGSGYGALTGLLACRCKEVTVVEDLDENAQVNRQRNEGKGMIRFLRSLPLEEKGGFDWVILCGPEKEKGLTDQLQALAPFLKEDGCLALACANGLGLPYLSGAPAPQEEGSFSLSQVKEALLAAGLGYQEFYYPMPDYRLPTSIFSRRYLPGAGDLGSPAVSWQGKRYA